MRLNEQYELELRNYQNIIKRNQNIYIGGYFFHTSFITPNMPTYLIIRKQISMN